jgi:hypothetical protein
MIELELMREACALLIEDMTATPISIEGLDDMEPYPLSPSEAVQKARSEFAAAIRKMSWEEAREIYWLNRDERRPAKTHSEDGQ